MSKSFQEPYPEVFADLGAYSAMTQGGSVDVLEYAEWVKRWSHWFSVYANVDAIGDAKGTRENQERLESLGLNPLPVFHTGESFDVLEWYLERYPYMALGGMVPYAIHPEKLIPWIVKCFKLAGGRTVFHGFGCTTWDIIKAIPWYSVDSSTWGTGFRFGKVKIFDPHHGRFVEAILGDYKKTFKHARLIRDLGFDPEDFADRTKNKRSMICAVAALSYMKAESWLRDRHGLVYIPKRDDSPGMKTYLADSRGNSIGDLVSAAAGAKLYLADTTSGAQDSAAALSVIRSHQRKEPGL